MKLTCCFIPEGTEETSKQIISYAKVHLLPPSAKFDDEPAFLTDLMLMTSCKAPAEWQIWYGETSDDNTLACTTHVGELLNPDTENRVYQVEQEK